MIMPLVLLLLLAAQSVLAEFLNPAPAPWKSRSIFRVGEKQTITYKTPSKAYTIAIWQQALHGGFAKLGPVLYETKDGPKSSFDWSVQLYDFDLDLSNVFFLWMFDGNASAQGNQSLSNMPSSFFNITEEPLPESSSTLSPSSITTTAGTTTVSTSNPATSTSGESKKSENEGQPAAGGLSPGASAGIGIGAALGVIAIAGGIVAFTMARRRKRTQVPEIQPYSSYEMRSEAKSPSAQTLSIPVEVAATTPKTYTELP